MLPVPSCAFLRVVDSNRTQAHSKRRTQSRIGHHAAPSGSRRSDRAWRQSRQTACSCPAGTSGSKFHLPPRLSIAKPLEVPCTKPLRAFGKFLSKASIRLSKCRSASLKAFVLVDGDNHGDRASPPSQLDFGPCFRLVYQSRKILSGVCDRVLLPGHGLKCTGICT